MSPEFVTLSDIQRARERIASMVNATPAIQSDAMSKRFGAPIWLKLEHRQTTGSFKLRGASNALALLTREQKKRGVVAASTGNHGRALAYAAGRDGVRAIICISRLAPENKVSAIRNLGAEVRIVGKSQDEAQEEVARLVAEQAMTAVPPFDDPAIIAGQGTIGLEIAQDIANISMIAVPVSGGGLAAGVAAAIKALQPRVKIIGVSMARGAAMRASLDAGLPVRTVETSSLADSLGGGIGLDNRLTFAMCRDMLDDLVLLSEDEIAGGVAYAYSQEHEIVEGAGAVAIGALLAGKIRPAGPLVLLLSGRNIDMDLHRRVVCGERGIFCEGAA